MDFKAARRHMVDSQIRTNDVTDPRVQAAFELVERERYLPAELRSHAYIDREVVYAPGRAMLTPRDHSKLLQALAILPGDLVLDVASGAGYSTAILSQLAEMVVAVEGDEPLSARAQQVWGESGVVNAAVITSNPVNGAAKQGPFDAIVIATAIEIEPTALLNQLKDGGRLGAIRRRNGVSKGVVWTRSGDVFASHEVFDAAARAIPAEFARPKAFVF